MLDAPSQVFKTDGDFLEAAMRLLKSFADIDPAMSFNAIMILLMVRKANATNKPITSQEMAQELLIHPATVSRVLSYLGEGKADEGFNGLGLIRIDFDKTDRRKRVITFTNRGWRTIRKAIQSARNPEHA